MKLARVLIIITFLFSCKSEKSQKLGDDVEFVFYKDGKVSAYLGENSFKNSETNILNSDGIQFARKGMFKEAKVSLLQALKMEPDNPTLLNNLGNVEHRLKNYKNATLYFEKSFSKSDSLYLNAGLNLGLLYWKEYEFEKSVRVLEYVLLNSDNQYEKACANYQLAKTYLDINKCKESGKALKGAQNGLKEIKGFEEKLKSLENEIKSCVQQ